MPLIVKNNEELDHEEALKREMENQAIPELSLEAKSALVSHIQGVWEDAKRAKLEVEKQILSNMRQRAGVYDDEKLAQIKQLGGSEIFLMITNTKCRAAEAWVKDIVFQQGKAPFALKPTPVVEIPDDLREEVEKRFFDDHIGAMIDEGIASGTPPDPMMLAKVTERMMTEFRRRVKILLNERAGEKAEEMRDEINDQFVEGKWYKALNEAIPDMILKTGFIKGPIIRSVKHIVTKSVKGKLIPKVEDELIPEWERRPPKDIFPSLGSTGINDGDLIDRIYLRPPQIESLKGAPGYRPEEIEKVLEECNSGSIRYWTGTDQEISEVENKETISIQEWEKIDCLNYWGNVRGSLLLDWGMSTKDVPDPTKYYDVCAWMIGDHIIKCMLNEDPLGNKPYAKLSFVEDGTFWGKGLPELIFDIQQAANACARSLVNNVGMASGPQVSVNMEKLFPGESDELWPWKRWHTQNDAMLTSGEPIKFFQPRFIAENLIAVFNFFLRLADEHSGIPAYSHGDPQVGGAGNTASGLSMLMTQAARGIKNIIKGIDDNIITDCVERQYYWNIRRKEYTGLIGDHKIVALGSAALISKEQQATRMVELLGMTNNPTDFSIMGPKGREALLRSTFKAHDEDPDALIPKKFEMPKMPVITPGPGPTAAAPATLDVAGNPAQGVEAQTVQGRGGPPAMPPGPTVTAP